MLTSSRGYHQTMRLPLTARLLDSLRIPTTPQQTALLERFADWLIDEASDAGGIGPQEADRIDDRHIADSVAFLMGFANDVGSIVDLGSGVGLPGLPLAILRPSTHFTLVDRSGRRYALAARAVRVLGLSNVDLIRTDARHLGQVFDGLVSRAMTGPEEMVEIIGNLVRPGGRAVIAGSRTERPTVEGFTTVALPAGILDRPLWLLMMDRP